MVISPKVSLLRYFHHRVWALFTLIEEINVLLTKRKMVISIQLGSKIWLPSMKLIMDWKDTYSYRIILYRALKLKRNTLLSITSKTTSKVTLLKSNKENNTNQLRTLKRFHKIILIANLWLIQIWPAKEL